MRQLPLRRTLPLVSAVALSMTLQPLAFSSGSGAQDERYKPGEWEKAVDGGPGKSIPDRFHPDVIAGYDVPEPRKGGRVIVHLSIQPKNMNYMVENSAVTRRMLREVHEMLVERDWETWEHKPILTDPWVEEDTVVLKGGRGEGNTNILYGAVTEEGDAYVVTPRSPKNPLEEPRRVAKSDVERVERSTVYTFKLKDGIKWHDGHPLDADDIMFSFGCYRNPAVDCDNVRFQFEKMAAGEKLDDRSFRFFFEQQYFNAIDVFTSLTILPSHLYNLSDPDNPNAARDASDAEQGKFVNEHPANTSWVGLGPYRVTDWNSQWVDAKRFDDYFNADEGGHLDEIRWRHIPDDESAKLALISGELDYWDRMRSEDYYGEYVKQKAFTEDYYKSLAPYTYCGYTTWNMRREKFSDPNVRRALNMCFNWPPYIETLYQGLASRVTGNAYYFSPTYDRTIEPVPFDLEGAEELLLDAGWYDSDDDGIIDKDGVPFVIDYLMPTGNIASRNFGQKYQEHLAEVGVKMNIVTREWATFLEDIYERNYDCANLAWVPDLESDPEQIWHSKWAGKRSSNHCGLADDKVDELIAQIQVELDTQKRYALMHALQERVYELQPYNFGLNQPKKVVVSKRIRNFRNYAEDPGYRIRDWYIVERDKE